MQRSLLELGESPQRPGAIPRLSEISGAAVAAISRPVQVLPAKRGIYEFHEISSQECAEALGLKPSTPTDVENHQSSLPTLPGVPKICPV